MVISWKKMTVTCIAILLMAWFTSSDTDETSAHTSTARTRTGMTSRRSPATVDTTSSGGSLQPSVPVVTIAVELSADAFKTMATEMERRKIGSNHGTKLDHVQLFAAIIVAVVLLYLELIKPQFDYYFGPSVYVTSVVRCPALFQTRIRCYFSKIED